MLSFRNRFVCLVPIEAALEQRVNTFSLTMAPLRAPQGASFLVSTASSSKSFLSFRLGPNPEAGNGARGVGPVL